MDIKNFCCCCLQKIMCFKIVYPVYRWIDQKTKNQNIYLLQRHLHVRPNQEVFNTSRLSTVLVVVVVGFFFLVALLISSYVSFFIWGYFFLGSFYKCLYTCIAAVGLSRDEEVEWVRVSWHSPRVYFRYFYLWEISLILSFPVETYYDVILRYFIPSVDKSTGSKKTDESKEDSNASKEKKHVKKKRNRSHFTQVQLRYLDDVFSRQQYLTRDERALLANALDMTELQIRNWFQNRRYQLRHRGVNKPRQVPVKVLVSSSTGHASEADWKQDAGRFLVRKFWRVSKLFYNRCDIINQMLLNMLK